MPTPSQLLPSAAEQPVPNAPCLWCHARLPAVDMRHQVRRWSSWSFDTGLGEMRTKEGHTATSNPMHSRIIKRRLFKALICSCSVSLLNKDVNLCFTASGVPMELRGIQPTNTVSLVWPGLLLKGKSPWPLNHYPSGLSALNITLMNSHEHITSRPSQGSNNNLGRARGLTVSEQHSVRSLQRGCAIKTLRPLLTRCAISEHHTTAANTYLCPLTP